MICLLPRDVSVKAGVPDGMVLEMSVRDQLFCRVAMAGEVGAYRPVSLDHFDEMKL